MVRATVSKAADLGSIPSGAAIHNYSSFAVTQRLRFLLYRAVFQYQQKVRPKSFL